ncbi:MAG: putative TrmH family tRNA/rRNA methyltransferase [Syntrophorhabdus sp. PtaB.Bin184]|jgi:23S rRNA (guanosine2251-2'-O)-methyltransferase|nr:MAG: putative TrmH family tRNA/rRNA methyltransferase [Syntrophorhabdus sp. PtaB.Bin184]
MPFLFNRNSIREALKNHPGKARRLLIRQGHERLSEELIEEAKRQGVSYRVLPSEAFAKKCGSPRSHVCLERDDFDYTGQDTFLDRLDSMGPVFLGALDGVQDPQNLGNIARSAACMGVDALILPKDRSCVINDTVANISRGATEFIEVVRVTNLSRYLDALKKRGIFCYGLDERGATAIWEVDLRGPVCLVFGGEEGLRRLTKETCDTLVRIPTNPSFPSLNVATSFALACYEVMKKRL